MKKKLGGGNSAHLDVQRRTTVQAAILKFHKHCEGSQAYITVGISYGASYNTSPTWISAHRYL